jgi:hypothetical protein
MSSETGRALQGPADGQDLRLVRRARPRAAPHRVGARIRRRRRGAGLELRLCRPARSRASWRPGASISASPAPTWCRSSDPGLGTGGREIEPMGFGHADLVIAVPRRWVDVTTLDDLDAVAARVPRAPRLPAAHRHEVPPAGARVPARCTGWPITASSTARARPRARSPTRPPRRSPTSPPPATRCAPTTSRCSALAITKPPKQATASG